MTAFSHYSVLLNESVDALVTNVDGVYIDGTFGRGGHAKAILARLSDRGRLMAFDRDPQAVEVGRQLEAEDPRFSIVHQPFQNIAEEIHRAGLPAPDGVLLDLGVSSPQLDDPERGFSFLRDGPLDMRMDNTRGETAAHWLARASSDDIAEVLREWGEERFAKRMARAVVKAREEKPIIRTGELAEIISAANPKWEKGKHPATRAFQAIRIFINRELVDLPGALEATLTELNAGGRFVVISFHSLEDRIVKRFFRDAVRGDELPAGLPIPESARNQRARVVNKARRANDNELAENSRSRSAVMRVIEKIDRRAAS